jgi:hypothetical protein
MLEVFERTGPVRPPPEQLPRTLPGGLLIEDQGIGVAPERDTCLLERP